MDATIVGLIPITVWDALMANLIWTVLALNLVQVVISTLLALASNVILYAVTVKAPPIVVSLVI